MEERRQIRFLPHQDDSRIRDDRPQKPKRWLAHQGHDRPEDVKAPHFRVEHGRNR